MDHIDLAIINALQEDARRPLSEISNKINLSLPAVSERLRKLERAGLIKQYTAILDPEKFGKTITCFCFIALKNDGPLSDEAFIEFIDNEPQILECHYVSGEYEFAVKIVAENTRELEAVLQRIRTNIPTIRTNTYITLSTLKNKPSIDPEIINIKK